MKIPLIALNATTTRSPRSKLFLSSVLLCKLQSGAHNKSSSSAMARKRKITAAPDARAALIKAVAETEGRELTGLVAHAPFETVSDSDIDSTTEALINPYCHLHSLLCIA